MYSDVFWGESKSVRSHLLALSPYGSNDVECPDGAEAVIQGKFLMGVVGSHPQLRRRKKMLVTALTGQAAAESDQKWETVSPRMAFF